VAVWHSLPATATSYRPVPPCRAAALSRELPERHSVDGEWVAGGARTTRPAIVGITVVAVAVACRHDPADRPPYTVSAPRLAASAVRSGNVGAISAGTARR
jgi:hypothetical protein